jgi:hypothetical protein
MLAPRVGVADTVARRRDEGPCRDSGSRPRAERGEIHFLS